MRSLSLRTPREETPEHLVLGLCISGRKVNTGCGVSTIPTLGKQSRGMRLPPLSKEGAPGYVCILG